MTGLILFEERVNEIRINADAIAGTTFVLEHLDSNPFISGRYDLAQSARKLREVADKIESIANRSKDNAVQEG